MKKSLLIIIVLTNILLVSCNEQSEEKFIEQFVIDLFDDNIFPNEVITNYLEIRKETNSGGVTFIQRLKAVKEFIKETRKPVKENITDNWLIPNNKIRQIKNPRVYSFNDYEHLSKIKLKAINPIRNRVYVLLNQERNKILQYFLLNKSKTKILSFSLLVKDNNQGSFFIL